VRVRTAPRSRRKLSRHTHVALAVVLFVVVAAVSADVAMAATWPQARPGGITRPAAQLHYATTDKEIPHP
jgi:hypothetical protein